MEPLICIFTLNPIFAYLQSWCKNSHCFSNRSNRYWSAFTKKAHHNAVNHLLTNVSIVSFNPFMPSGLFYLKSLDRSISYIKSVWLLVHWWSYHMARLLSVCLSVNIFKRLLLQNRWADWSQISCGASMRRGNESLFAGSSHMTKMAAMPIYG